jgi:lipopolysaccharide biosynthesis protein
VKSITDSVWRKLKTLSNQQQANQFLKEMKIQALKRQKEKKSNDAVPLHLHRCDQSGYARFSKRDPASSDWLAGRKR